MKLMAAGNFIVSFSTDWHQVFFRGRLVARRFPSRLGAAHYLAVLLEDKLNEK